MNRLIADYEDRARILPDRTGGQKRIGREDFATGWIAHALRCGEQAYLSAEVRLRLGSTKGAGPAALGVCETVNMASM
jgi:hypothetical protein